MEIETKKNYLISASILSADFDCLGEQIAEAESAGVDWIHIDVMDGHFVPNLTMGPFIVETCQRITRLPIDVHLMVEKPELMINDFSRAGANIISVHVETCPNLHRTLNEIHALGCKAGVVLNPGSPAWLITPVLPLVDLVLVMTTNPGFSGQVFYPEVLPKIREIRDCLDRINPPAVIEVDGGINTETLPKALSAGAQVFVSATAIFKNSLGITACVKSLRSLFPK
jgi:ribulose-phosphate 3-epimerase